MLTAIYSVFYAGVSLYVLAGIMALRYSRTADARHLDAALACARIGAFGFFLALAGRWLLWSQLPLTGLTDVLILLVLLSTLVQEVLIRDRAVKALLSFYLPPLALISLINGLVAPQYLGEAPLLLRGVPLIIHVGLAFSAYALFFLAAMTSAAYLVQARRLKERRTHGFFQHLPSLEELDRSLMKLIAAGYPFFLVTVFLGGAWAWMDRDLLGDQWWMSPKVILSLVMALFYALLFHGRRSGRLQGKKRASVILAGFSILLFAFMALSLVGLRNWQFWGGGA